MARLTVAQLGNPVLVRRAEPVSAADLAGPEIQGLIDDMIETMYRAPGVGLAAPQVSRSLRLFVMDPGGDEPGEELRVIVNPELTFPGSDSLELWEGCLSIPGIRGRTERHAVVDLDYLDRQGRACRERFVDFSAAVVQHENDHLDGVFFLSRMPDLGALAFEEEYLRWHAPPLEEGEEAEAREDPAAPEEDGVGGAPEATDGRARSETADGRARSETADGRAGSETADGRSGPDPGSA